jgi:hypothetical protein
MLGYAKAINKQQQRTGSLLQKGFRRKNIPDILRVCLNFYHLAPSGKFCFSLRYIFRRTASSYA